MRAEIAGKPPNGVNIRNPFVFPYLKRLVSEQIYSSVLHGVEQRDGNLVMTKRDSSVHVRCDHPRHCAH